MHRYIVDCVSGLDWWPTNSWLCRETM